MCGSRAISDAVLVSRPLIEGMVRRRVRKISNVHVCDGCQVQELIATSGNSRVTGINTGGTAMLADLVVDATGRGSRSPSWLQAMGYRKVRERELKST